MRSKLDTKSRLAAHIVALILLIMMLVYSTPPQVRETSLSQPSIPVQQPEPLRRPVAHTPPPPQREADIAAPATQEPGAIVPSEIESAPAASGKSEDIPEENKPAETPAEPEPAVGPSAGAEPDRSVIEAVAVPADPAPVPQEPATEAHPASPSGEATSETAVSAPAEMPATEAAAETSDTAGDSSGAAETPGAAIPPVLQPDESGALVVAASETGAKMPVPALAPIGNTDLEVLGDNVYWLDSRFNLEKELAAIPEIGTLILLTRIPGEHIAGIEHIRTETISADAGDLSADAAERFLHLAAGQNAPVVIAALPGARGAAYFKGVYLLANRNLEPAEMLKEIRPKLEEAGTAADEIVHRLLRLNLSVLESRKRDER